MVARFSFCFLLSTALLARSNAQNLLPTCAYTCFSKAVSGDDGCTVGDLKCYCAPPGSDKYFACVQGDCDASGQQAFLAYAQPRCFMYGSFKLSGATPSAIASASATSFSVPSISIPTSYNDPLTLISIPTAAATRAATPPPVYGVSTGPNIGAIVGGVIGGILGVALLVLGAILRRRRHRRLLAAIQANQQGQHGVNWHQTPPGIQTSPNQGAGGMAMHSGSYQPQMTESGAHGLHSGVSSAPVSSGPAPGKTPEAGVTEHPHGEQSWTRL